MKTINGKQIAIIAGLILAILTTGLYWNNNRILKKNLKAEKIKSEALLSEKLLLDKSLEKIKSDVASLQTKNSQLDKKIVDITGEIEAKESELRGLKSENSNLRSFKAKVKELESSIAKLNQELKTLKDEAEIERNKLMFDNQALNNKLASIQKENEKLVEKNTIIRAMASNNHRVEAVRGKKDRLTAIARRTQRLILAFDLPNDVGSNIYFKLITPEGRNFTSVNSELAKIDLRPNNDNFFAQNSQLENVPTKSVEMIYTPSSKLTSGVYEFEVYNENGYIGSSKIRLR
jgi:myosin heavy subunit